MLLSVCLLLSFHADASELVVLQLSAGDQADESERRFAEELSLAIDDLTITFHAMEGGDFVRAPLTAQVERVRPLLGDSGGSAVAWLDRIGPDHLGLALVFVTDDRAVVRLVQAEQGPEGEAELALAAREILWSTLDPAVAPVPKPVAEPAAEPRSLRSTGDRTLGARVALLGEISPVGGVGPSPRVGLEVAADLFFAERLAVGLGLGGWSSLLTDVNGLDVRVSRAAVAGRLQLWTLPVAPFVQAELPLTWVQVDDLTETHLGPRGVLGATGHWGSLMVELRSSVWLFRDIYLHGPTDQVVYDSGRWDVMLAVGWRGPT